MPTTIDEEQLYRDRVFDPYLSLMIFIASMIALFPLISLLAFIQEGDIGKMATAYATAAALITIIGSYMFSQTIGYENFLEKYNLLIPSEKPFSEYFDEKLHEYESIKDLHDEFKVYFIGIEAVLDGTDPFEFKKTTERFEAYKNIVADITTPEEIRRLCNILIPFSSTQFRGVEIKQIQKLSQDYFTVLVQFREDILHVEEILSKYITPSELEMHN